MGLKEDILFLEIVYFLLGGSSAAAMGGGRAAPLWAWHRAQKDGCAQARSKPTNLTIKRAHCPGPEKREANHWLFV